MSAGSPSFLFINVARIGDTLLATPAMRAIATAHPGCRITALAHPKRAEVLRGLPFVARVGGITKNTAPWRGLLGGRRYDYALVYGFDEALVAYALRVAGSVVAFRQRNEALNRRLYRCVDEAPAGTENAVARCLRLTTALGIPAAGRRLAYRVTQHEAAAAHARLAAEVSAEASPLIGMNVATFPTKVFRRWPVAQFGELAEGIIAERPRAHVLIFGGREEVEDARRLKDQLRDRAVLYAGRLSLRESAAMMSLTDLYVGLDTGPTHLMSAFDIPLVALYHCRIPSRQIAPLDHPCLYALDHPRQGRDCAESTPMSEITVDAVLAQVRRALAEHPPRRPSSQAGARFA
ncbi:MAG TPA: glycosyltransferase family 9 protein [Burkholderiales bacterium]|nr:glycosyltransferase family 9 protein [Burkholderiales bacterium]